MISRVGRHPLVIGAVAAALMLSMASAAVAQRGGRGGGGSGPAVPGAEVRSRLEILSDVFTLDKDQRRAVKDTLDASHKNAAPIRAGLKKTRTDLAAAVQAGKPQEEIDAGAKAYGAQAALMAEAEMTALAAVLTPLQADQRKQGTNHAFNLMRGIFLDDDKWDEIPEKKGY